MKEYIDTEKGGLDDIVCSRLILKFIVKLFGSFIYMIKTYRYGIASEMKLFSHIFVSACTMARDQFSY